MRRWLHREGYYQHAPTGAELNDDATFSARAGELFLRIESGILLATVAVLPLAYLPGLLVDFVNMPKLNLLFVVVIVASALRLGSFLLAVGTRFQTALVPPALGMAGAFVASWLASDYRGWSLLGLYSRYSGLLPYLAIIAFAALVADAFAGRARTLVRALVVAGAGVGLFGLIQMLFLGAQVATSSETAYITSTLGHSNFAGGFLAVMLPLSLSLWAEDGTSSRWAMLATVLIGSSWLFTVSQGAWAAGIAGVAIFVALRARDAARWVRLAAYSTAAAAAIASVGIVLVTIVIPHAFARLPAVFGTAASRGFLWRIAGSLGIERPLVGWGPNVFAIEGTLHRNLEDALLLNFVTGDDPHSVALAMFANLGVLGVAAFTFLFLWAVMRWRELKPSGALEAGVMAALAAYVVQSLVSIDVITLRFALWVLLATVACWTAGTTARPQRRPSTARFALAVTILVVALAGAAVTVRALAGADLRVAQATYALDRRETGDSFAHFRAGLRLRNDNEYRRRYAEALARTGLARGGEGGAPLIQEMNRVLAYLREFPEPQGSAFWGERLLGWSVHDRRALDQADDVLMRARRLDPHNPLVAVLVADVALTRGLPADAEQELAGFEEILTEDFPEYAALYGDVWSTLAMARAKLGRIDDARATLARVTDEHSCRYHVASQLVKPVHRQRRTPTIGLICPQILTELIPDRSGATRGGGESSG